MPLDFRFVKADVLSVARRLNIKQNTNNLNVSYFLHN